MQLFSKEWVSTWVNAINNDPKYRAESESWAWPVAIEISSDNSSETTSIYLDLKHGECKRWFYNEPEKSTSAAYIFQAPSSHWEALINEQKDPIFCIIKGYIKLKKGNILSLSRYSKSGKRLLELCPAFPGNDISEPAVNGTAALAPEIQTSRTSFTSTETGLDFDSFPMQLFQKSKKLGIWNPSDIDFSKDREHWESLNEDEQRLLLHLTSLFVAGEESVTADILPLISAIAREGRVEEEIYLTSFLWEEAKHTEFFNLFLKTVAINEESLSAFHSPCYKQIFYEELPAAMNTLYSDASPVAQARAAVTYNMIVEGTLAETGYHAYYSMLDKADIMPGLKEGIGHLKRDEARHIAYGLYLIARLISEDPAIYDVVQARMEELLEPAIGFINEIFQEYNDDMPFGLQREDFIEFALSQFRKRLDKLKQASSLGLENIMFD